MTEITIKYMYIGDGIIPTVPPRDLTEEDVKNLVGGVLGGTITEVKKSLTKSKLYTTYTVDDKEKS